MRFVCMEVPPARSDGGCGYKSFLAGIGLVHGAWMEFVGALPNVQPSHLIVAERRGRGGRFSTFPAGAFLYAGVTLARHSSSQRRQSGGQGARDLGQTLHTREASIPPRCLGLLQPGNPVFPGALDSTLTKVVGPAFLRFSRRQRVEFSDRHGA